MNLTDKLKRYFTARSPFRITTDLLFYLLILSLILPFSRKFVAVGLNKAVMHRPAVIRENNREMLSDRDFDWVMAEGDGNLVPFSRFSGEMIFLSFWATWCPPCRAEMPNIQRLYNEFGKLCP